MDRFAFDGPAEIIAHRGFSAAAPENTLAALRAAIDAGADALEFDLQVTSDGEPVLFHDDTLERTTDAEGDIRAWSAAELAEVDAGFWFAEAFRGEPVPRLAHALELAAGWGGRLYPELKGVSAPEEVDRIVDHVVRQGLLTRTVFIAMDWSLLDRVRVHEPDAAVGYIVESARQVEDGISRAGGDPLALLDFEKSVPVRDRDGTARARALRIPMAAWTVDDPRDADRLLEVGVTRITTNRVDRMLEWRSGLSAR
jgi:glycerophosphoryl diester phosphodiesterase